MRWSTAAGASLGAVGAACAVAGARAYRDVRTTLERERVTGVGGGVPVGTAVRDPASARAMAETIRCRTLDTTEGRTYAEVSSYVDAEGQPTRDRASALVDERTGTPLRNPEVDLWLQSMTLQSALMQAYAGFRVAQLTMAVGGALALAGLGVARTGAR
jgi:hypothetical protein